MFYPIRKRQELQKKKFELEKEYAIISYNNGLEIIYDSL